VRYAVFGIHRAEKLFWDMLRSVSPAFEELQKRLLQEQQLNKEQKEKLMQPRERENKNYNKSMVPKKQDLNQERILLIKKHAAMEIEEQALKEELKALQKEIEEKNFMTKQESYVQTQENDAKPGSQDTIAEIDCFIERRVRRHLSMKTLRQMPTQIVLGKQQIARVS